LCQIAYASVPGWCAYNQYAIPDWYYGNGCYVGPVCSAGYCGAYAVPVYNTFYNRGSRYNYWNSRTFVHNNITRIAHWHDAISRIHGSQHGPTVAMHHNVAPVLKVNRSPLALAKHNNSHPRTRAVAHSRPKAAAHPKARTLAHAAPRPHPQHVAHVARPRHVAHAHPQHVARAHAQSGHGRHK
jgi:hypothetical protein